MLVQRLVFILPIWPLYIHRIDKNIILESGSQKISNNTHFFLLLVAPSFLLRQFRAADQLKSASVIHLLLKTDRCCNLIWTRALFQLNRTKNTFFGEPQESRFTLNFLKYLTLAVRSTASADSVFSLVEKLKSFRQLTYWSDLVHTVTLYLKDWGKNCQQEKINANNN